MGIYDPTADLAANTQYPWMPPTLKPRSAKPATAVIPPVNVVATQPKAAPLTTGMGFNLPSISSVGMGFTTAPSVPPVTANAVTNAVQLPGAQDGDAGATSTGASQRDVRITEKGSSASQTPPGAGGSTSPNGTGYNVVPTSESSITRVNVAGQSPLFTNMDPGTALDDINKKGAPLPSVPGFLAGVKSGGFGLVSPKATVEGVSPLDAKAAALGQQSDSLFNTGGLVDAWKARGLRRQSMETTNQSTALKNTAVAQQANALHQEGLQQQYALGLAQNAATQRGQDMALAPHLGDIAINAGIINALKAGDMEKARDVATVRSPKSIVNSKFVPVHDPIKGFIGAMDETSGKFNPYDQAAVAAENKRQTAIKAASGQ